MHACAFIDILYCYHSSVLHVSKHAEHAAFKCNSIAPHPHHPPMALYIYYTTHLSSTCTLAQHACSIKMQLHCNIGNPPPPHTHICTYMHHR